ncbi:Histidinol-phosphate aminotransferase [hydrothermal vent metagenome]|uniref:Histidinol-phosphate aminotransferase n=1 Tax=hydrothermal vent metagenome TaxID=652676 RepID=A0A3B0UER0_9ZZZZ
MINKPDIQKLFRKNVAQLTPYSSARDEFSGRAEIWLDANESPFPNGFNRYPDPLQWKLKETVAKLKKVNIENIFIGNGSDEVLDLLFRAFCEPRLDNVVTIRPSYGMYQVLANVNDVQCRQAELNPDFSLNAERLLALADDYTRLILLCSPNNPTGNAFDAEAIVYLLENTKAIVVLDEAYIDFSENPGFLAKLSRYPGLVIVQTLSKAWGMAALRLGLGFADEEIIRVLNRIKPPYNINLLSQQEVLKRLQNQKETLRQIRIILKEKEKMRRALLNLPAVKRVFPSDANFLLLEISNATDIYQKLMSKGVVVRNRSGLLHCYSCLRITIGTPEENERLLSELNNLISASGVHD